ncbi:uncharacterized protein LOC144094054 isoform X3 [Amblyomma americanum]
MTGEVLTRDRFFVVEEFYAPVLSVGIFDARHKRVVFISLIVDPAPFPDLNIADEARLPKGPCWAWELCASGCVESPAGIGQRLHILQTVGSVPVGQRNPRPEEPHRFFPVPFDAERVLCQGAFKAAQEGRAVFSAEVL